MCKLNPALKEKATVITPKTIAEDVKSIKDKAKPGRYATSAKGPGTVAKLANPWHK